MFLTVTRALWIIRNYCKENCCILLAATGLSTGLSTGNVSLIAFGNKVGYVERRVCSGGIAHLTSAVTLHCSKWIVLIHSPIFDEEIL